VNVAKINTHSQAKRGSPSVITPRRNSRTITNVPIQQQTPPVPSQPKETTAPPTTHSNQQKLFAFESFDDSLRRFQRLREIRKNLRTKYEDQTAPVRFIDDVIQLSNAFRLILDDSRE
jgi:hypothetical protein